MTLSSRLDELERVARAAKAWLFALPRNEYEEEWLSKYCKAGRRDWHIRRHSLRFFREHFAAEVRALIGDGKERAALSPTETDGEGG